MVAWKNLTAPERRRLHAQLRRGLADRGISATRIELVSSRLAGHYRLYVVAPEFQRLDFSEQLNVLSGALEDSWPRQDRLRLTQIMPVSPDELPQPALRSRPARRRKISLKKRRAVG